MHIFMRTVCDFINANLEPEGSQPPGRVSVHCEMEISRSSTMVIAYMMRKLGKGRDEILEQSKSHIATSETEFKLHGAVGDLGEGRVRCVGR